ncbi:hypothetical protein [Deinococcus radiophilus]|uniref:hypothetical protein n=1 Tax=Deinococcus radiophilus TaxID=32062 RepID=UPI0036066708
MVREPMTQVEQAKPKPYARMKDSGVPWLGEVPEHWEVKRGKNILKVIDVRSQQGTEELLTVSSERGSFLGQALRSPCSKLSPMQGTSSVGPMTL